MEEIKATFTIEQKEPITASFKAYEEPPSIGGTTNYNWLDNKPSINDVVLTGNKTLGELGIQSVGDYATQTDVMQAIASIPQFKLSIVDTLPSIGEKMTLYLVPKEGTNNDVYDEYIWVEQTSSFEFLGTTAVDLTDYVKNTDYASANTAGVVKVSDAFGIIKNEDGALYTARASLESYKAKSKHYAIGKDTLENIKNDLVKRAVTENDIVLTDEEKTNACNWLGVSKTGVIKLTETSVELATNTIYNAEEMVALYITFPQVDEQYVSQLNFTSGATATAFTAPDTIKWIGNDVSDNAFVPLTNKRYAIMFYFDGVNVRGAIQGVV